MDQLYEKQKFVKLWDFLHEEIDQLKKLNFMVFMNRMT